MSHEDLSMFAEERRDEILNQLNRDGRVLVKELAEKFSVSIDSIRRDLSIMEQHGLLKKTHGGAIPPSKVRQPPLSPEQRFSKGTPQGNAIAKLAVSYIREKDTVFIAGSALSYLLLQHLPDQMALTVVTNSIRVADVVKDRNWIDTYFIGGRVKPSGNITDALSSEFVRHFKFDVSFVTGGGISSDGVFVSTPEVAAFGRTVSSVSRRRIGIATHHAVGNDGFARVGNVEDLDVLITDEEADPEAIERIRSLGVRVVIAKTEEQ